MRIISGLYKGRNILGHDLVGTRPTMERVKESLFAIIQSQIKDATILDLFSGSGNLGIEALSQGAKEAYLVDKNDKACYTIKKNIENLSVLGAKVIHSDYKRALSLFYEQNKKFDLIFLDPPYQTDYIEKSIEFIDNFDLLQKDGLIICESDDINKIIYSEKYMVKVSKKYGDKWVVILKKI